jgi:hypothetical protein
MTVALLSNHNVRSAVVTGLRLRGVDIVTARELSASRLPDDELLDLGARLQRVLVSHDDDLIAEAHKRQVGGSPFPGVVYCHQSKLTVGAMIEELELLAKASELSDLQDQVVFLPL